MATPQIDPLAQPDTTVPAKKSAPVRSNFLAPRALQAAEQAYTRHCALAPPGTTEQDLTRPEFYQAVSQKLRSFDRIDVIAEDRTFVAEVIVKSTTPTSADVELLMFKTLVQTVSGQEKLLAEYDILYVPTSKWRVVRKSDSRVLSENHNSDRDALSWLLAHKIRTNTN